MRFYIQLERVSICNQAIYISTPQGIARVGWVGIGQVQADLHRGKEVQK